MKKNIKIILLVVLAVVQLITIVMLFLVRNELKTQIDMQEKSNEASVAIEETTTVSTEKETVKKPLTKPVGEGYAAWTLYDIDCDGEDELIESYYKRHTDAPATTRVYDSEDDYHEYPISSNCLIYNESTKKMCLACSWVSLPDEYSGGSVNFRFLNDLEKETYLYASQGRDGSAFLVLDNNDSVSVSEFESYASDLTYIKQFNIVGDISGSEEGANPFTVMSDICEKAKRAELAN